MLIAHRHLEITDQAKKLDDAKVEIPKIGSDEMGIGYDYDWDKKVENALSMKRGVTGIPLDYIVRRDKDPGWDPTTDADNEHEKLIYQVKLVGNAFDF